MASPSLREKHLARDDPSVELSGATRDEMDLLKQGKVQQLNRNFGFIQLLGLGTSMMATWEAIYLANETAMENGGAPSLVYGFVFCWIGALCTAASLAELASIAPIAGGQYHWVAMLAPERHKYFLSWVTGWLAMTGWIANIAAGIYFSGTLIQGLIVVNNADYDYKNWEGTLLMCLVVVLIVLVNTVAARLLPTVELVILAIHTLGFLAITIPFVHLSEHETATEVFKDWVNTAGWSSNGLAFFVGLLSNNLPLIGYDGPTHLAEEAKNATMNVPRVMVLSVIINGVLGFATCIAFAFCTTDFAAAADSATGYDFIYDFQQATNSAVGTSVMITVLLILTTCASMSFLATTSRLVFAFARDNGLPGSRWLSKVSPRRKVPENAVAFCAFMTVLICLINVWSSAAFNAITSVTIAGLYFSYFVPTALVLYRRLRGDPVAWGPWTLGRLGPAVNVITIVYLLISAVFSFFPATIDPTLTSMNWSCAVFGGLFIIGLVYYIVRGHKRWTGPVRED